MPLKLERSHIFPAFTPVSLSIKHIDDTEINNAESCIQCTVNSNTSQRKLLRLLPATVVANLGGFLQRGGPGIQKSGESLAWH